MLKLILVGCIVTHVVICGIVPRSIEIVESTEEETTQAIEIPIKIGPRKSTKDAFPVFVPGEDPFLDFIGKMTNITYISSQVALNRIKERTNMLKEVGGQVDGILRKLPTFPIPIVDDLSHSRLLK